MTHFPEGKRERKGEKNAGEGDRDRGWAVDECGRIELVARACPH